MKFQARALNVFCGCLQIPFDPKEIEVVEKLQNAINAGKKVEVQIDVAKKKRSLNANAYLWVLLGEIANVLHTDKDEVYLQMLERYGVYTHVVVKPSVVERVKQEWRTVRELGSVTINGQTGIQLQCYFGSHTYNTQEFTRLLDGVISEARGLGIDVLSDADKDLMLKEWGNGNTSKSV